MIKIANEKKAVWIQLAIILVIVVAIFAVSALTYDNGVIEEEPFLSEDPDSDHYYKDALNSSDVTFTGVIAYEYTDIISELFPKAKVVEATTWNDMIMRNNYGLEDAFLVEESDKDYILQSNPTLYCIDDVITTTEYHFVADKSSEGTALIAEINEFIKKTQDDGTLARLQEKWKGIDSGNEEPPESEIVEYAADAEVLTVCTEPDWPPFSYIYGNDSDLAGYFIDFLSLFCAEYGYRPEYVSVTGYDSCQMGLKSGDYDIVPGYVYSEERAEQVMFSEAMVEENLCCIVRASEVEGLDLDEYIQGVGFFDNLSHSLYRNLIEADRWKMLAKGLLNTLIISLFSILCGTALGAGVYYLGSRKNIFVSSLGKLYVNVFQRLPQVLLLLILCYIVFGGKGIPGMAICIVCFSLSFAAYIAEMFRTGIEAIPGGQTNAALALGFNRIQTFFTIVLPQVIRITLPVYKGQIVLLILETSIAGYIAVEDLTKMSDIIRANTLEALVPMMISALIYFLITLLIGLGIGFLERKLDPKHRRRLPKWVSELEKENKK